VRTCFPLSAVSTLLCLVACKQDPASAPAPTAPTPTSPSPATPVERPAPTAAPTAVTGVPPQTVGAEPDCSNYPVADIERVWGPGVQPPAPGGSNKVRPINGPTNYQWTCRYDYDDGLGLSIALEFRVWATDDEAKQDFANAREGEIYGKGPPASVPAGDEGFVATPAEKDVSRLIYVRAGRVRVLFSATNLGGAKPDYTDKLVQTFKLRWP